MKCTIKAKKPSYLTYNGNNSEIRLKDKRKKNKIIKSFMIEIYRGKPIFKSDAKGSNKFKLRSAKRREKKKKKRTTWIKIRYIYRKSELHARRDVISCKLCHFIFTVSVFSPYIYYFCQNLKKKHTESKKNLDRKKRCFFSPFLVLLCLMYMTENVGQSRFLWLLS